ncbi:unnamed protein product [Rhodiola kirilowii]
MTLKEGQSITRPPLLEGSNYATWKPVMKSFLKSLDEKVCGRLVLKDWTEPMMNNLTGENRSQNQKHCGQKRRTSIYEKLKGYERNFFRRR